MTVMNVDETMPPVVKAFFNTDKHEFYLTGSRYFGTHGLGSDWDFFVEDSLGVRQFLVSLGFEFVTNKDYGDDRMTVATYCYENVDVQLVNDRYIKEKAQLLLKRNSLISHDKITNKVIWTAMILGLQAGKE